MNIILSFYKSHFIAIGGVNHFEISNGERDKRGEVSYVLDMQLDDETIELFCSALCQDDPVLLTEDRVIVDLREVNYLQIDSTVLIGREGQLSFEVAERLKEVIR